MIIASIAGVGSIVDIELMPKIVIKVKGKYLEITILG
jgi:hypothetical protein